MANRRVIRNKARSARKYFRLSKVCLAVLVTLGAGNIALANPIGGAVVNGQASFNTSGNTLTVTNTPGTIINWQGFSINAGEVTHFAQQSASSTVLNRVVTNNPSVILGTLSSNGQVYLVNANGIVFGAGSTVDVAGLVATSLNLSNADFLAGRHNYTAVPGAQNVSNAGNINAQQGGQIYLIAPNVENSGIITAPNGEILLAAGNSVQLVNSLDPNLRVSITAPAGNATNLGKLIVESGSLGLFGTMVKNSGVVSADSAVAQGGKIVFKASQLAQVGGTVSATGTTGGTIEVLGNQVAITSNASIDASGANGGGTVLVGGDAHGANPNVQNAQDTYVDATATIKADATQNGNGGKVVVWSDKATQFNGNISARGGSLSGNGGWVEVSGKNWLGYAGLADMRAPNGIAGSLLLDPSDITINAGPDALGGGTFAGGIFQGASSAVAPAVISWGTINTQLGLGALTIQTTTGTGGTGIITIGASGTLTATNTLTLLANSDIVFSNNVVMTAAGDVNLVAGWSNIGQSVTPGTGTITLNPGSSISTPGNIWLNAGNSVVEAIGGTAGTITANTLSIGNTNGGSLPGGVSLTGANMVNTLAVQIDSATGSLAFTNGKALTIGSGTTGFNGIVATGNPSAIGVTTTAGGITVNQSVTSAGPVSLTAAGAINESGGGLINTAGLLTTISAGGTVLNGANTVGSFNATNSTAGNIALTNTAATLTLTGINNSFATGSITVNNTGAISITGLITASGGGAINLAAVGDAAASISETGSGTINTTGLLTTSSVAGQDLFLIGTNTVGSFNATNSTSGGIRLFNATPTLTITGLSQSGGGAVDIINSGDISTTGAIITSGAVPTAVALVSSGNITVGNAITATGGPLNLSLNHGAAGSATLAGSLSLLGGSLDVQNAGVPGTGTLNVNTGATSLTGALTAAALVNNGSMYLSGTGNSVTGSMTQNGLLVIASGGTLATPSFTNTGTLAGGGTLDLGTGTITNNGIIAPGGIGTVGTLSITGNLVMGATGVLNVDLNSPSSGNYDVLNVSGVATLSGGTLSVAGAGAAGSYTVLNATGGFGATTFITINAGVLLLKPTYAATTLDVTISAPPTPPLLSGSALLTPPLLSELVNATTDNRKDRQTAALDVLAASGANLPSGATVLVCQ